MTLTTHLLALSIIRSVLFGGRELQPPDGESRPQAKNSVAEIFISSPLAGFDLVDHVLLERATIDAVFHGDLFSLPCLLTLADDDNDASRRNASSNKRSRNAMPSLSSILLNYRRHIRSM